MSFERMRWSWRAAALGALWLWAGRAEALDPGLYAAFDTSMGSVTCRLDYVRAPRTVAHFVGLAEGSRAWIDPIANRVRQAPFYDGLIFHRVINNFMIQGGSPAGTGTDGPGYAFRDEFHPDLRHDGPGVLSMANSGWHSNGSQFFITLAATPWLNDVHSVFGRVVDGQNVVTAIGAVAVDANSKPLENVTLNAVRILRVGAEAEAFDPSAHGLPEVRTVPVAFGASPAELSFDGHAYSTYHLFGSHTLATWVREDLGMTLDTVEARLVQSVDTAARATFFAMARVDYPAPLFTPPSVDGTTYLFDMPAYGDQLELHFAGGGVGTYRFINELYPPGTITGYTWIQEPYRGRLSVSFSELLPMTFDLDFQTAHSGRYTCRVYATTPFDIVGTFTRTAP